MEGSSSTETRKAVCRSFANVVKGSGLAEIIDPKSFFMMLSSNFPAIYRGGKLHLAPIWDALAPKASTDDLIGLFFRFELAAEELRIPAVLPPALRDLPPEVRQQHLARFTSGDNAHLQDPSGLTPLMAIESVNENPELIQLGAADLRPLITDDLRRRVSQAIVSAIRASAMGTRIQPAQVAYMIDTNFESLCDGVHFDLRPVDQALRDLGGVSDGDIYGVVVRLQDALEGTGIQLALAPLSLDAETMAAIEMRARAKPSRVSDPRVPAVPGVPPTPVKRDTPKGEIAAVPGETRSAASLRRFGFSSSSPKRTLIERGVLGAILLSLIVVLYANRPNRPLDLDTYNAILPFQKVELLSGNFQGRLDDARWYQLEAKQRDKAIADLEVLLKEKKLIQDMQVLDARNSVVIANKGPSLVAAAIIMRMRLPGAEGASKEASAAKEKQ